MLDQQLITGAASLILILAVIGYQFYAWRKAERRASDAQLEIAGLIEENIELEIIAREQAAVIAMGDNVSAQERAADWLARIGVNRFEDAETRELYGALN